MKNFDKDIYEVRAMLEQDFIESGLPFEVPQEVLRRQAEAVLEMLEGIEA